MVILIIILLIPVIVVAGILWRKHNIENIDTLMDEYDLEK